MAVKIKDEIDKSLCLEIDNGDLSKLKEVMEKWAFKDYQSFLRFAVSIMLLTEDNYLSIKLEGIFKNIAPAADYLKDKQ